MTDQDLQAEEPAEAATPEVENAETATAPESGDAEKPEASEETPEEKPKPKGGFQRRIDELTRNWREAERRNDELLSILKGRGPEPEQQAPQKTPTLEEFGYDESKYQAALTDYVRNLTKAEAKAIFEQERQASAQETRVKSFKQREADFASEYEDYAEKVYDPTLPLSATVVELIAESEIGPKVAYHLADNPDIARTLYTLSPTQAAREFGKLEAKLSSGPSRKVVSTAPPPPPKISATEATVEKDPDKMSMDEWLKWREKQTRKRR